MSVPLASMTAPGVDLPALAFCHTSPFDRHLFRPPVNVVSVNGKPTGGLWLSPIVAPESTRSDNDGSPAVIRSRWSLLHRSIIGQDAGSVWPVVIRPDARILRIDSHAEFEAVYTTHFPAPPSPPPLDMFDSLMGKALGRGFDYESMAEQFDALWLTERGVAETRHTQPGLNTWDCESVLVLRASAIEV